MQTSFLNSTGSTCDFTDKTKASADYLSMLNAKTIADKRAFAGLVINNRCASLTQQEEAKNLLAGLTLTALTNYSDIKQVITGLTAENDTANTSKVGVLPQIFVDNSAQKTSLLSGTTGIIVVSVVALAVLGIVYKILK